MAALFIAPIDPRSPFEEDVDLNELAVCLGFFVQYRRRVVEVLDENALAEAGFMTTKPRPDYQKIAKSIEAGIEVPGAQLGGMEYVLRPKEGGVA